MNEEIEGILKSVEVLVRGGGSTKELEQLFEESVLLLRWCSKDLSTVKESYDNPQKENYVNQAIKLHNKVRNLVNKAHAEVRTVLKTVSAWILYELSPLKLHGASMILKLFIRTSQELQEHSRIQEFAYGCAGQIVKLWPKLNVEGLSESIPPMEFQDIKVGAFQAYLDCASMCPSGPQEILAYLRKAQEFVEYFTTTLKLSFINVALSVGSRMTNHQEFSEGCQVFRMALGVLDGIIRLHQHTQDGSSNDPEFATVLSFKIKAELSLAYVYTELNQCDKALLCIRDCENIPTPSNQQSAEKLGAKELRQAILLGKFNTYVKLSDWVEVDRVLRQLLKLTSSYDLVSRCIQLFLEKNTLNKTENGVEYFKLLVAKYPNDPEFTMTRIANILHLLNSTLLPEENAAMNATVISDNNRRALDLCSAIVTDHTNHIRCLSEASFSSVRRLVTQRLSHLRAHQQWAAVLAWADVAIKLLQHPILHNNDNNNSGSGVNEKLLQHQLLLSEVTMVEMDETLTKVYLHKADALANLKQFNDALETAMLSLKCSKSIAVVVVIFKICLLSKSSEDTLTLLWKILAQRQQQQRQQQKHGIEGILLSSPVLVPSIVPSTSEDLQAISQCLAVCDEPFIRPTPRDLYQTKTALLREWLRLCHTSKQWLAPVTVDPVVVAIGDGKATTTATRKSKKQVKFLDVVAKLCQMNLEHLVVVSDLLPSSTSSNNLTPPPPATAPPVVVAMPTPTIVLAKPTDNYDNSNNTPNDDDNAVVAVAVTVDVADKASDKMCVDGGASTSLSPLQRPPKRSLHESKQTDKPAKQSPTATTTTTTTTTTTLQVDGNSKKRFRYPDSLLSITNQDITFHFTKPLCELLLLRDTLLHALEALKEIEETDVDADVELLGRFATIEWLADVAWNVGTMLLKATDASFPLESAANDNNNAHQRRNERKLSRLLLAAEFFEASCSLFSWVPYEDLSVLVVNQCLCLVVAAGARLDADACMQQQQQQEELSTSLSSSTGALELLDIYPRSFSDSHLSESTKTTDTAAMVGNLAMVEKNVVQVDLLIRNNIGIHQDAPRVDSIRKLAFRYHFAEACIVGGKKLTNFMVQQREQFFLLSAAELYECSCTVKQQRRGTMDAMRSVLCFAYQVLVRSQQLDRQLIGVVVGCLLDLSTSYSALLSRVEEFEQLLLANNNNNNNNNNSSNDSNDNNSNNSNGFNEEHIDYMVFLVYNGGVSQSECGGDAVLAEALMHKAIALLPFASPRQQQQRETMMNSYRLVLEKKEEKIRQLNQIKQLGLTTTNAINIDVGDNNNSNNNLNRIADPILKQSLMI